MTRTISLITATVGAALLFAVPAWGDNWGNDRQDQAIVNAMAEDGFDDAVLAAKQIKLATMLNARERGLNVSQDKQNSSTFDARSEGLNRLYGLGEYAELDRLLRETGARREEPDEARAVRRWLRRPQRGAQPHVRTGRVRSARRR